MLIQKGLDPQSILKRYREHGQRTVLFDFADTGKSVASLLYVMLDFGLTKDEKKQLEAAISLSVYYPLADMSVKNFSVDGYSFPNNIFLSESQTKGQKEILRELANTNEYRFTVKNPILKYENLSSDFDPETDIEGVTKYIKNSVGTFLL